LIEGCRDESLSQFWPNGILALVSPDEEFQAKVMGSRFDLDGRERLLITGCGKPDAGSEVQVGALDRIVAVGDRFGEGVL
tara:strand:- start:347 stop:586 length:240 start_codon:yes stop_codon:yes gene_type:complete